MAESFTKAINSLWVAKYNGRVKRCQLLDQIGYGMEIRNMQKHKSTGPHKPLEEKEMAAPYEKKSNKNL